jgi:hypothetical protein
VVLTVVILIRITGYRVGELEDLVRHPVWFTPFIRAGKSKTISRTAARKQKETCNISVTVMRKNGGRQKTEPPAKRREKIKRRIIRVWSVNATRRDQFAEYRLRA